MTLSELSQLQHLKNEIECERLRLSECDNEDVSKIIKERIEKCEQQQVRLECYISDIPDSLTRQVFTLRFVNALSWAKVARIIGNNSADSVRMICRRYIEKERDD